MDSLPYYSQRFSYGFNTQRYTAMDAGRIVTPAPFGAD